MTRIHNITLLILVALVGQLSCDSHKERSLGKQVGDEVINMKAPFYTQQLPDGSPRISKNYDSSKEELFFPFILYNDGSYMVSA